MIKLGWRSREVLFWSCTAARPRATVAAVRPLVGLIFVAADLGDRSPVFSG